jgi:hypothetical protein
MLALRSERGHQAVDLTLVAGGTEAAFVHH